MRVAHICCGRGGSLWTGAILGWDSVLAFDWDEWRCQAVAADGWPGLTVACGDIATVDWDSVGVADVECIAAGFSCRDISAAGGRAGLDGKSTGPTWRGCLRAIDHYRPDWVFFENTPRIKPYRPTIWRAMRDRGYDPRDGTLDATGVGAPHLRTRWFMLAHRANADGAREPQPQRVQRDQWGRPGDLVQEDAPDAVADRCHKAPPRTWISSQRRRGEIDGCALIEAATDYCGAHRWNPPHTGLLRVVDGLADRGKRIAALGDAWVPLQAAVAWRLLGGPVMWLSEEKGTV